MDYREDREEDNDPSFDLMFPKLSKVMNEFEVIMNLKEVQAFFQNEKIGKKKKQERHDEFWKATKDLIFPRIEDEMNSIIPEWKILMKTFDQNVCIHTLYVVYLIYVNEEAQLLSLRDQNILKWSALLHDICKLGPPFFSGKDHIHPFKSARQALIIFKRLGVIRTESKKQQDDFDLCIRLLDDSTQPVKPEWALHFKPEEKYCDKMHSHLYLSDIFTMLWESLTPRGGFADLVFRLVLFHQSLPGIEKIPPIVALTKEERLIYCDDQLFKLIKILMMSDSKSYMYIHDVDDKMTCCMHDFQNNHEMIVADWHSKIALLNYHLHFSSQQRK